MCVIVAVDRDGKRPSRDHVDAFWEKNNDGAGIAWFDGKKVVFQKGLLLGEIQDLVKSAPLPFVAHFRIATCGGVIRRLTHPFEISATSPLNLRGSTTNPLLFHNGVWGGWEKKAIDIVSFTGWKLPEGPWSDSRLMAWFAANAGLGVLDLLALDKQRIVTLDPASQKLHLIGDWKEDEGKFWVSNELWRGVYLARKGGGKMTQVSSAVNPPQAGSGEATTANPPSPTTSGPALSLIDPRTTAMGPTDQKVIGPAGFLVSPPKEDGPTGKGSAIDLSSSSGDPFPNCGVELDAFVRLVNLEKTWVMIQEARMRHREGMDSRRYKSLQAMYHRRRDEIQKALRLEMVEEARLQAEVVSSSPITLPEKTTTRDSSNKPLLM